MKRISGLAILIALCLWPAGLSAQSAALMGAHNYYKELNAQGRYAEAEPYARRALELGEKEFGPDGRKTAVLLNRLASLYHDQGRYADAEPLYERSLAIWEKALGPDHPAVAIGLAYLARLYRRVGRFAQAEPLLKRALGIHEKASGGDHPDVATSLNNLARLYVLQGRYGDAEPLYKRSLAIREKALGSDHPSIATSLDNIAALYKHQGRYTEAKPLQKRSLEIRGKGGESVIKPLPKETGTSVVKAEPKDDIPESKEPGIEAVWSSIVKAVEEFLPKEWPEGQTEAPKDSGTSVVKAEPKDDIPESKEPGIEAVWSSIVKAVEEFLPKEWPEGQSEPQDAN